MTLRDHIIAGTEGSEALDSLQLNQLEQSFRQWFEEATARKDIRISRQRIFIIFLLIRYTGAKLNEVLKLKPFEDIDTSRHCIIFHMHGHDGEKNLREVHIPETVSKVLQLLLAEPHFQEPARKLFDVDPGFVRRKFYERSRSCGFSTRLGGPEMIRKARAVELLRNNMPLPAVQRLLGHSNPNLTSAYVTFSDEELRRATKFHIDREFSRKTSACNSFFGKISAIHKDDIQALIELTTIGGEVVQAIITHGSLQRLGLAVGRLVTAEIKAPWIVLMKQEEDPRCSAENRFNGVIEKIARGKINTEYSIRLEDGTEICSITGTESNRPYLLREGDRVWALFNCYAVVLHVD
ncbi:MAG: TOBE domain-containing protein [Proteobacteria bacterium]|nr:TOBE domain-containing protein [Pseudomonadota bacterium]